MALQVGLIFGQKSEPGAVFKPLPLFIFKHDDAAVIVQVLLENKIHAPEQFIQIGCTGRGLADLFGYKGIIGTGVNFQKQVFGRVSLGLDPV